MAVSPLVPLLLRSGKQTLLPAFWTASHKFLTLQWCCSQRAPLERRSLHLLQRMRHVLLSRRHPVGCVQRCICNYLVTMGSVCSHKVVPSSSLLTKSTNPLARSPTLSRPRRCVLKRRCRSLTIQIRGNKNLRFRMQVSPYDCTGCGVCADVCQDGALEMKPIDTQVGPDSCYSTELMAELTF